MHEKFLLKALEQAKKGQGFCAPNPSVGAVAVQNENIIAQAFHQGAGTPHAEQLLLAQLPPKLPGVSLYITLEPCNHWGRTPPCVSAIIEYGIEQVFYAYTDPNPLVVQNRSCATLTEHGIKVAHIALKEINEFYQSYTYWTRTGKPRVTVKLAQSLDGKIGQENARFILSNEQCQQLTHKLRAKTDVILTTAKTIDCDNPKMNVRLPEAQYSKPVAIIDSQLSIDKRAEIFKSAKHCHIYHLGSKNIDYPNSSFYSMPASPSGMDLSAILSHLGELGYHDVWVEAGGELFSSLHKAGLVHRTYLYIVPINLGDKAVSAYKESGLFERKHSISWQVLGNNMVACLDWQEDVCF